MNALAGGGTFATLPALIALGLPANLANATSNVALLPGAAASAAEFRDELAPVGGIPVRTDVLEELSTQPKFAGMKAYSAGL